MKRLCVFLGSSLGKADRYAVETRTFGELLAKQGIGLVYGGASVGLMGVLADSVLEHGGEVTGVIPDSLQEREIAHPNLTELRIVRSMHERKHLMFELSDAFVAMPGGLGTLDEVCEILTWRQLGIHSKPCAIWNMHGFFDPLIAFFLSAKESGFISEKTLKEFSVSEDAATLLAWVQAQVTHHVER